MTTENQHYCNEHQCFYKRFEKGEKTWYAHKDGDNWCNETKKDKPKEQSKPEQVFKVEPEKREYPKDETKTFKADLATRVSIELQQAIITAKDLWIAGKLQDGEPEIIGLRQWIRDRLCPNALQGKIEVLKPPANPITKTEVAKALTDKGYPTVEKIRPTELATIQELLKIPGNKERISATIKEKGWKATKPSELSQPQAAIILGLFPDDDNPPIENRPF
jgi:hypothetical protein